MVVFSENIAVWNLMPVLYCNVELLEAANRNGRNRTEQVIEPPKCDLLEMEMRTNGKQYIQFVTRMLPPVYGKEVWNEVAKKQSCLILARQVKKLSHYCSTRMAMKHGPGCYQIHRHPLMVMGLRRQWFQLSSTLPDQKLG
jgi:hypothetical protein